MLSQRFYYTLKPYLPWRLRMAIRRVAARRTRRNSHSFWPIDKSSSQSPAGWPGWPDGKKFSVVLTHDVESPDGLAKCRALMELDQQFGFRSAFNFTPAGTYRVPAELRREITQNGFEVGIHDLEHDGKLFISRGAFEKKAMRINEFMREWGASGFRSAFMLRNLDWMHSLDIAYDSSTFDTDPFELQANGAKTIFPFWNPTRRTAGLPEHSSPLPGANDAGGARLRGGYFELPYTLPQDSTLFLVLGEKSPEIWTRKLDWIAQHGGMALVNVHPDYILFDGQKASARTYPVSYYREFLQYLRQRYAGEFWQPTPRELVAYVATMEPRPTLERARKVCMITHSFYESDNRVTRYAEALAARGDQVDVIALRRSPQLPKEETINGVRVVRIQDRFSKTESSISAHAWPLLRFLVSSSFWLTPRHAKHRYDLLHIHNMPDFLVFAGWYPKLTGVKVILDIHDIVPEFYQSKFGSGNKIMAIGLLNWMERRSAHFASHVIVANHLWLERYETRTGSYGKCSVFINNVDTHTFQSRRRTRDDGKIIILFPGGLQWHQGLDIALRAFTTVSSALPQAEFHIYGDGNMKPSLMTLAAQLGFNGKVKFFDPVKITEIARVMANADLGVVPKRADSFGNEAYSTKIMEFMSLGVPVVASKTKIDQYYFDDSVLRFFESGNSAALAEAIIEVLMNSQLRTKMVANALDYSQRNSWMSRKGAYLSIVDELIGDADPQGRLVPAEVIK